MNENTSIASTGAVSIGMGSISQTKPKSKNQKLDRPDETLPTTQITMMWRSVAVISWTVSSTLSKEDPEPVKPGSQNHRENVSNLIITQYGFRSSFKI
jgi:hypothetical protein